MRMFHKLIAVILAILLVLSLSTMVLAHEVEDDYIEEPCMPCEEELKELAAEIFPEFANKILDNQMCITPCSITTEDDYTVVFSETRSISDDQSINYQEYANGTYSVLFRKIVTVTDSSTGSGYSNKELHITGLHSSIPGAMTIYGIKITLVQGGYDQIADKGYTDTSVIPVTIEDYRRSEGASLPALAVYVGQYEHADVGWPGTKISVCKIYVQVGNDDFRVTTSCEVVEGV